MIINKTKLKTTPKIFISVIYILTFLIFVVIFLQFIIQDANLFGVDLIIIFGILAGTIVLIFIVYIMMTLMNNPNDSSLYTTPEKPGGGYVTYTVEYVIKYWYVVLIILALVLFLIFESSNKIDLGSNINLVGGILLTILGIILIYSVYKGSKWLTNFPYYRISKDAGHGYELMMKIIYYVIGIVLLSAGLIALWVYFIP